MAILNVLRDAGENLLLSLPLIGAYVIFALGIVVIFRASRVLNLAHGAMAMAPAYVYFELTSRMHFPVGVGVTVGVLAGGVLGAVVERFFVRPLRKISPTAQTVGTVAAFGLTVAIIAKVFGTLAVIPVSVFPDGELAIGSANLRTGAIGLFFVGLAVAAGLQALFRFTDLGLAMRAAADNRRAAALMGVDPDRTTTVAWVIGGATAGLAGILLAASSTLQPYTLSLQALPGFVSVLIGGLGSMVGAVTGGAITGAVIGLAPILPALGSAPGAPQLVLMFLAFVVMVLRGQRFAASDVRAEGITGGGSAESSRVTSPRRRRLRGDVAAVGMALALAFPKLPGVTSSLIADADLAFIYALVGISLVLLIGYVGQISLAHASFVGIGAFVTGRVITDVPFPANLPIAAAAGGVLAMALGVVALRVRGLYLAVATLIFAWMTDSFLFQQRWLVGLGGSTSFGVPTLGPHEGFPHFDFSDRTTFYYVGLAAVGAVAGTVALLKRGKTGRAFFAVRGSEMAAASLGIDVTKYKLLAFAMSGVIAGVAGNLFAAHSGVVVTSEFTFTVSLFYLSIAVVGGLTSLGGAVAAGFVFAGLNEVFFRVDALSGYLDVVSAGLLTGVLLSYPSGLAGIPASAQRLVWRAAPLGHWLARRTAGQRHTIARGAAAFGSQLRQWMRSPFERAGSGASASEAVAAEVVDAGDETGAEPRVGPTPLERLLVLKSGANGNGAGRGEAAGGAGPVTDPGALVDIETLDGVGAAASALGVLLARADQGVVPKAQLARRRESRELMLSAESVVMRFGGLTAVNDVSLSVREGEIVGLIGPNGAGKTTMFNCISGLLVPTEGRVELFGRDVTNLAVHERAQLGLGRTFQVIQLFSQLSVFDNLLVATHIGNPTGVVSHLVASKRALLAERAANYAVARVVELFGLKDLAEQPVGGLPFGVLRMVELARAIVSGARLVMLDEPASGLDDNETRELADLLLTLRAGLGLTMLVIEHDVKMVTSVSDYMYVLDQGCVLAEGTPEHVQRDPAVIAAYLGEPAEGATV